MVRRPETAILPYARGVERNRCFQSRIEAREEKLALTTTSRETSKNATLIFLSPIRAPPSPAPVRAPVHKADRARYVAHDKAVLPSGSEGAQGVTWLVQ